MIGSTISLARQLQANAFNFLIESLWSFLFLKIIDFSINNGLINFLFNFQLSVSKERLLLLSTDLTFIIGCNLKPEVIVFWLLYYKISDFFCFDIFQFFTFSNFVTLSHYWHFSCHLINIQNKTQLNILKSWKIYIIVLTASTPLSWRNQLNFLILSLTVIYTLSFRSYEISCIVIAFIGFSWKNRGTDILILVDSWWLSWLRKQSFSKI